MSEGQIRRFVHYATTMSTAMRAFKVACIVTPILTVFNHFHDIVALNLGGRFFLQVLLTFFVPYLVSTYSSAMTELKNAMNSGELDG